MGFLGIPGTDGVLNSFNLSSILGTIGQFIVLLVMFLLVGGIWYWFYYKKKKAKLYNKKIFWFEEVHGVMVPLGEPDKACELVVPGTNINVFYIKKKDMYLPRPVKRMGANNYWFAIRNNRELVNFTMKNINEEMTEANLDYDHTDMRYALTNLKELIKRNYRDKSQPWWREYKDIISVVILIFVLTLSFIFLFSKVGQLISQIGSLIEHTENLIKLAEVKAGSGVIIT